MSTVNIPPKVNVEEVRVPYTLTDASWAQAHLAALDAGDANLASARTVADIRRLVEALKERRLSTNDRRTKAATTRAINTLTVAMEDSTKAAEARRDAEINRTKQILIDIAQREQASGDVEITVHKPQGFLSNDGIGQRFNVVARVAGTTIRRFVSVVVMMRVDTGEGKVVADKITAGEFETNSIFDAIAAATVEASGGVRLALIELQESDKVLKTEVLAALAEAGA